MKLLGIPSSQRDQKNQKKKGDNKNMQGQNYVWRVKAKKLFVNHPKLNRIFTNKVDALSYLNALQAKGYKNSVIEKWQGDRA